MSLPGSIKGHSSALLPASVRVNVLTVKGKRRSEYEKKDEATKMQILFTVGMFINIYITFLQSTVHSKYRGIQSKCLWEGGCVLN